MPLRSPKMYFCILGFQRLVWCPKWTPASSSSFIVSAAIVPPCRFASAAIPGEDPRHRQFAACVMGELRRVLGVDPDVLLGEVAGPHAVLAPAEAEVDGDRVLRSPHDLSDAADARAVSQHALLDQRLVVEGDRHPLLIHPYRRLAQRHHDPAPVGVL